jgi:hypothetical protein
MPVGACDHCGHCYVLEQDRLGERRCPCCHQPLRVTNPREVAARLGRQEVHPARPAASPRIGLHTVADNLLLAESLTRWATEAVTAAQRLQEQAREAVAAAAALRSERMVQRLERQEQQWQREEALRGA